MKKIKFKRLLSLSLVGLTIFSIVGSSLPLRAKAQVSSSALTVTAGSSQTATFTHKHKNSGSITTKQIQSNSTVTGATASGYCYTTKVQHTHEGNLTSGGNCYTAKYHTHVESCYPHHTHTDNCKNWQDKYSFSHTDNEHDYTHAYGFTCCCGDYIGDGGYMQDGGYRAYNHTWAECCNGGDPSRGVVHTYCFLWWNNEAGTWGSNNTCGHCWNPCNVGGVSNKNAPWTGTVRNNKYVYWKESFGYTCGYTAGQRTSNTPICGKTTSTVEGWQLKSPCPYYTSPLYTNSCGLSAGQTIAKATVSADNNNKLTLSVSNTVSGKTNYSYYWVKPDGSTVNNANNIQCTENGTYKCVVTVTTKINNQTVDNDTVTFSYTAVPHNTTVNFYDYNGTKLNTITMKRGSENASVTKPTRTGYTFTGYYLNNGSTQYYNQNGSKVVNNFCALNGGTINLYAKYTPNQYTVNYETHNLDIDTTLMKSDTATYDSAITLSNNAKTYTGYTFDGWYNGNTKLFNTDRTFTSAKWNITNNVTLTAKYHSNSYTLNYSLNKEEAVNSHSKTVNYDSAYGLSATDIANRREYTGYTFNGWYDGSTKIFNADGSNTDTGIWKFTKTINAKATYTANPYKVYYNTKESDAPSKVLNVTYDSSYALPNTDVSAVPTKPGYTFDGWFDTTTNAKIFNIDGTPVSNPYKFDHDITVMVKYHKNSYIINYNDDDIDDTNLDKSQTVTFDTAYLPINQAPYKVGYVFDGHQLEGTVTFIWDGHGDVIHAVWDFLCGTDGNTVNAKKVYSPKTFTVDLGSDFDNDGVIDSIESTKTATYDSAYFDLEIPAHIDGYTFDGWYLYGDNIGRYIATYDPATNTLTKADATWVYDDNINWVNESHNNLKLIKKWHKNTYTVNYNDTDTNDTNLDKSTTITFDTPYSDILPSPYKTGYIFEGHIINGDTVWDKDGRATHSVWDFVLGEDNATSNALKKYTAKTITVDIGDDFDNDGVIDSVDATETVTFDATFFNVTTPAYINGYTFDGYYLLENNEWIATYDYATDTLSKTSNTWIWDDNKDWNTATPTRFTVVRKWHRNTYHVRYNNTDISDTNLNKTLNVVYGNSYADIDISPYKTGYIFDGHFFLDYLGSEQQIWDNIGKATRTAFDFEQNPTNDTTSDAYKKYHAKTFIVEVGDDYDENGVLDSVDITDSATYDSTFFDLPIPATRTGLTFDGYYILGTNTCVAKYDETSNTLTKTSNTWVYDDNEDWNNNPTHNDTIRVESRWTHNEIDVTVNTETSEKVVDGVGNLSAYKYAVTHRTEHYDRGYNNIAVPTKRGYTFKGYIVSPKNASEEEVIFKASGEQQLSTFLWTGTVDPKKVNITSVFEKKQITGTIEAYKYKPETQENIPANILIDEIYDEPYSDLPTIPEKEGYDFDGIEDKDGNIVYDKDGKTTQEVWQYLEEDIDAFIIKWQPKTYILTWDNGKEQPITFGKEVPDISTMSKTGYTFSGYSFDFFGKETFIINGSGKFTSEKWLYDVGKTGTKIPLKDLYNANTYIITVKTADSEYAVEAVYNMAYNNVDIPLNKGHVFNGYVTEYNENYPDELSEPFWDEFGNAIKEAYTYPHDITVLATWTPKTFYLHCDDEVIAVTFGETIKKDAPVKTKDSTSDNNYKYDYIFDGWSYDNEEIFNELGKSTVGVWNKDLGANGTHIYLTDNYTENKTAIPKPEPEEPPVEPEPEPEIIIVPEEPKEDAPDYHYVVGIVVTTAVVTISTIAVFALVVLIILLLMYLNGKLTLLYVYDERKQKKVLKRILHIKKYKKNEKVDNVEYRINLPEKYEPKVLDFNSNLLAIRLSPYWIHERQTKRFDREVIFRKEDIKDVRIICRNNYNDYSTASVKTEKGDLDRGFIDNLTLDKTFN